MVEAIIRQERLDMIKLRCSRTLVLDSLAINLSGVIKYFFPPEVKTVEGGLSI